MKTKITTVLFDLDGVLIDSGPLVVGAFEHTLAHFATGKRFKDIADGGSPIRVVYGKVTTPDLLPQFIAEHAAFQQRSLHLVTAFQDTVSTMEFLRSQGVNIGVITNRSINARHIIEHCGLTALVRLVVSVEDVIQPKPHPEGILKALDYFKAKPSETLMVGDMPVDIQAGKAAGVVTVAVNTSDCLAELTKCAPDYLIEDLNSLISLFFA